MDISGMVLQGLQQAQTQLEHAAVRIAGAGASSVEGAPLDTVDLSAEVIALMSARTDFSLNAESFRTQQQMQKTAIDLLA